MVSNSQIAEFIEAFQKFKYTKIGCFTKSNTIGPEADGKTGPFNTFKKWITTTIEKRFNLMEASRFKNYIPRFKAFCELIEDRKLPIVFCHGDLVPKNMIEKEGKIVGLIDFEWSGAFPYIYDAANYFEDFNLDEKEKEQFKNY